MGSFGSQGWESCAKLQTSPISGVEGEAEKQRAGSSWSLEADFSSTRIYIFPLYSVELLEMHKLTNC